MNKHIIMVLLFLFSQIRLWAQVSISLPDTSGNNGQSINIPVYVGDLSGKNIIAYQFKVIFNSSVLTATGIEAAGTLSAATGWTALPNINVPGEITVGAFGSNALSGGGKLVYIKFDITGEGTSPLNFANFTFNSGNPTTIISNGNFSTLATESLTLISPNGGEEWEINTTHNIMWTSNGINNVKLEYTTNENSWSIIAASVSASSGSYPWLIPNTTSTQCKVRISDESDGNPLDLSNSTFTIKSNVNAQVSISLPDTSGTNGQSINIPVYVGDLSGKNIIAYQFKVIFNSSVLTATGIEAAGTLSAATGWTALPNINVPGEITVGAFGSNALSGGGKLVYIKFDITGEGTSPLNFANFTFNSGNPTTIISNGSFSTLATESLTLTIPNGGESWQVNSSHNITWTSTNVTNVKIEYSINNGTSWNPIIPSISALLGSYSWSVPNTPSTQCKVRISDTDNSTITDISDNIFTISSAPTVTVTSPNGGDNWQVGSSHNITWTSTNVTNVKLEYSTNNGTSWNPIIPSISALLGSYGWSVPNTPSTQCKVRISDANNSTITDISDNVFTISSVHVTFLKIGSVNVNAEGDIINVPIDVSNFLDVSAVSLKINYNAAQLSFINIINAPVTFTVNAAGGEITISWYDAQANSPINISSGKLLDLRLSYISGVVSYLTFNSSQSELANSLGNIIPFTYQNGQVNGPNPGLKITSPNGGENWQVGSTQNIIWTSNNISNVKIEYSTNNGNNWNNIIASTTASSGSYSWLIPNTPSTGCKVRISDVGGSLSDVSNNNFTIKLNTEYVLNVEKSGDGDGKIQIGNDAFELPYSKNFKKDTTITLKALPSVGSIFSNWASEASGDQNPIDIFMNEDKDIVTIFSLDKRIEVKIPNGFEEYYKNDTISILWQDIIDELVIIELFKNEEYYSTIGNGQNHLRQWVIPNAIEPGTNFKIRISKGFDWYIYDFSDNYFSINAEPVSVSNWMLPSEYNLRQNFPNPFNPSTTINYQLPKLSHVSLKIFNMLGEEVADLLNEEKLSGNYEINFNASGLSSGLYFYRIQAGDFIDTKKFILMK